jgi:hypothetical protein
LAARRRALGNELFAAGRFEDALAVYRLGADLVFHWRAAVTEDVDEQGGDQALLSPYDKERVRRATEHMNAEARKKYLENMRHQQLERQRRRRRRTTVSASGTIDGAWEGPGPEGSGSDAATIREAGELRGVCLVNAALCLLKLKRPADAKTECDAVLRDDDTNFRAYHRRCLAFLDLNQVSQAKEDLQTLAALRRREQERQEEDGSQVPDTMAAKTTQSGSSRSAAGSRGRWRSVVSEQDMDRLRAAVKRAEAQHISADKQLYSKMFSRKHPLGSRDGGGCGAGGGWGRGAGGGRSDEKKHAAERAADDLPGRKGEEEEEGPEAVLQEGEGRDRAGAREQGEDGAWGGGVGGNTEGGLGARKAEIVGTGGKGKQKMVVDRAVFVGGAGRGAIDEGRVVVVRNARVSPEEAAAQRQHAFDQEVCTRCGR